jgi:hypothetical protein
MMDTITIADRTAFGMYCSAGVIAYNARKTTTAATTPERGDFAPQSALTAVRENDPIIKIKTTGVLRAKQPVRRPPPTSNLPRDSLET